MKEKLLLPLAALAAAVVLSLTGCGGSTGDGSSSESSSAGSSSSNGGIVHYGTLVGTVSDTDGTNKLADVTIEVGGRSVKTNGQGYFVLDRLPENGETVVKLSKEGYVETAEVVAIHEGVSTQIDVFMRQAQAPVAIDASAGGTVSSGAASVEIGGGDLVDADGNAYHGTAHVSLTPFDPTTEAGRKAFPGEFKGVRQDGSVEPLVSYGFVDVTVTDGSNRKLQLRSGAEATLRIPIPSSLQGDAPSSMPLWWFNTEDGKWHEVGTLTRKGNVYEGKIPHFSIYNSDVGYSRSFVSGRFVDCQTGQPIVCGQIHIVGISPRNCWESGETCTASDGRFERIPVDANSVFKLWGTRSGISSTPQTLNALPSGQTMDIGDVCINNPRARITLTWNAEPDDLDAHLTFDGTNGREMVYFGHSEANDGSARLNTDDMDGYGPEIITIYALHDGINRYSVHQYSGQGTIGTSGARLNMVIDKNGNGLTDIYALQPDGLSGFTGIKDVWFGWDIYVDNGRVTKVETLDTVGHNIDAGDTSAFSPAR